MKLWKVTIVNGWKEAALIEAETAGKAKAKLLRMIGDVVPIKFVDLRARVA